MTTATKKISRKLKSSHRALLETYDDEDLHQLRINIRRARALLKSQSDKPSAALRKDWGLLAQRTNTGRDWDTLAIYAAGVLPSRHWCTLQPLVEDYRQQAHARVLETLRSNSWHTTLSRWNKLVKQSGTQAFAEVTLFGEKRKVVKRALKAGRRAMMRRDERNWHKFRIAIKNLRYSLDYSSAIGDREKDDLKAIKKICKRLQDELGNWHDTLAWLAIPSVNGTIIRLQDVKRATGRKARFTVLRSGLTRGAEFRTAEVLSLSVLPRLVVQGI